MSRTFRHARPPDRLANRGGSGLLAAMAQRRDIHAVFCQKNPVHNALSSSMTFSVTTMAARRQRTILLKSGLAYLPMTLRDEVR